jgi:hypothetical protein
MGMLIAPVMTEAMREVAPALAGTASGVLNTTRQLGSAIGVAVIGVVLQGQLSSAMHDRPSAPAVESTETSRRLV